MQNSSLSPTSPSTLPVCALGSFEGLQAQLGVVGTHEVSCKGGSIQLWDCGDGNFYVAQVDGNYPVRKLADNLSGRIGRKVIVNSLKHLEPSPGTRQVLCPQVIPLDKSITLVALS